MKYLLTDIHSFAFPVKNYKNIKIVVFKYYYIAEFMYIKPPQF